jgi:hypothetical protein
MGFGTVTKLVSVVRDGRSPISDTVTTPKKLSDKQRNAHCGKGVVAD